jgi:hypothetical protein
LLTPQRGIEKLVTIVVGGPKVAIRVQENRVSIVAIISTKATTATGSVKPLAPVVARESLKSDRDRNSLVARRFGLRSKTEVNSPTAEWEIGTWAIGGLHNIKIAPRQMEGFVRTKPTQSEYQRGKATLGSTAPGARSLSR